MANHSLKSCHLVTVNPFASVLDHVDGIEGAVVCGCATLPKIRCRERSHELQMIATLAAHPLYFFFPCAQIHSRRSSLLLSRRSSAHPCPGPRIGEKNLGRASGADVRPAPRRPPDINIHPNLFAPEGRHGFCPRRVAWPRGRSRHRSSIYRPRNKEARVSKIRA